MTSLLELGRAGASLREYDIVDIHGHLGRPNFSIPEVSAESLVRVMDLIGVRQAVCSYSMCLPSHAAASNDMILQATCDFPGRILGWVRPWPSDRTTVAAEIERCLDAGCVGIKLHDASGFPYDDEACEPAFEIAHDRGLPMLFHTWGSEKEFSDLGKKARSFPNVPMLLAHTGSTTLSGYVEIAREHENVYLELCLSACTRGLVERLAEQVPPGKIVWGSDALFINMAHQIGKVLGADIDESVKKMILSENAKRILQQTPPA